MSETNLKLVVIRGGPHAKTEFPLVQQVTTLGRSHKNTIVMNDHKVSRFHAEISRAPEGYVVRDLESANGVRVNGSKVQSSALVATDVVTIGDTDFRVDAMAEASEQKTVFCEESIMQGAANLPDAAPATPVQPTPPAIPAAPASPPPAVRMPLNPGFQAAGGQHAAVGGAPQAQTLLVLPNSAGPAPAPLPASNQIDPKKHPDQPGRPKLLEVVPPPTARIEVAGLDVLVGWIARRSPLAEAAPGASAEPSGIALVAPAGCGKSLIARFVAFRWQRPCYRLHLPYLVLYQPSEWPEKLAAALEYVSAAGPAILAIEDVDRAGERFESMGADVARGWLLASELLAHWVQSKASNPFVISTARDASKAHPGLFTAGGAVDEVFVIDLPSPRERQSAIEIALRSRGRSADALDPRAIADATNGFTIGQLNSGVNEALLRLGSSPRDLATAELLDALAAVRPAVESAVDAEIRRRHLGQFRAASTRLP